MRSSVNRMGITREDHGSEKSYFRRKYLTMSDSADYTEKLEPDNEH